MDLSLVIPCYNEEGNVKKFFEEAEKQFGHRGITYEYVFINDGSNDNTGRVLKELFDTKTEKIIEEVAQIPTKEPEEEQMQKQEIDELDQILNGMDDFENDFESEYDEN